MTAGSALLDGRFLIKAKLGQGGMGEVFKAHDKELDRTVAIKTVTRTGEKRAEAVRRMKREAKYAAQIKDPHLMDIFDSLEDSDGTAFMVCEYIEGRTLQSMIDSKDDELTYPACVVAIFVGLLRGLEAMHNAGFIHRDVKPSNVMVSVGSPGAPTASRVKVTAQRIANQ